MKSFQKIIAANSPAVVILIRFMVGAVFCAEGIQKFLYPEELGVGRFLKIGIPLPAFSAHLVGVFEIAGGFLVLLGCLTRLAAIPLITIISVAIATTKIPILLHKGFWSMAHEARTDWCMLLGGIFLLIVGGGRWSIDRYFGSQD
jgi:putative oxidoreductase